MIYMVMAMLLPLLVALVACDNGSAGNQQTPVVSSWQIGPILNGKNYSQGLPARPLLDAEGLWSITWTPNVSSAHYVTTATRSLTGKSRIYLKFRVDIPEGAMLYGTGCAKDTPTAVVPYFEREGDDWSGEGLMETYRWWYEADMIHLHATGGVFEITAPLDGPGWKAVMTKSYETATDEFVAAKMRASRIGFTFANCTGAGHGASATGLVKFTLLDWRVE